MLKASMIEKQALERLKERAETLLEKRGVIIEHQQLREELKKRGCEGSGTRIRFPNEVQRRALAAVPRDFTLYSPSGKFDLKFPVNGFYTRSNTGAPNYRTLEGETHPVRLSEADSWFELINALEEIDFCALPSVSAGEVPAEAVDLCTLARALQISQKHIWVQPYKVETVKLLIELAAAASGGMDKLREKPIVSFISCSVPLFTYQELDAEIILRCAQAGIPVQPCSLPTAGANTPVTPEGTALACSTEVLAQIIMLELLHPGLPVIATPLPFSMDMMTTYTLQAGPETTLSRMLCVQFFEEGYQIPAHTYGTGTDSLTMDGQDLIERTGLTQLVALSGASILGGAGQLETAKTISPLELVIDNELFKIARRFVRGVKAEDEELDFLELLDETTGAEGFIMTDHTLRHFAEATRPPLFTRCGVPTWREKGSPEFLDRALVRYREIVRNPQRLESAEGRAQAIDTALKKALDDLKGVAL